MPLPPLWIIAGVTKIGLAGYIYLRTRETPSHMTTDPDRCTGKPKSRDTTHGDTPPGPILIPLDDDA